MRQVSNKEFLDNNPRDVEEIAQTMLPAIGLIEMMGEDSKSGQEIIAMKGIAIQMTTRLLNKYNIEEK